MALLAARCSLRRAVIMRCPQLLLRSPQAICVPSRPRRLFCSESKPDDEKEDNGGKPATHVIQPLPGAAGLLLGAAAGCVPPSSWGLLAQSVTAMPLAFVMDAGAQAAWTTYQLLRYVRMKKAEHRDSWEPAPDGELAVGVHTNGMSIIMALFVVLARAAYEQSEQAAMLCELFADAKTVRALEMQLAAQQEELRKLQGDVRVLQTQVEDIRGH
jgi:hypothetical protein